jgi:hypothetical protein
MWFSIVQCIVEGGRRRRGASAGRTIITFSPEAGVQWNLWSAEKLSRAACGGLFWGVVMVRAGFFAPSGGKPCGCRNLLRIYFASTRRSNCYLGPRSIH